MRLRITQRQGIWLVALVVVAVSFWPGYRWWRHRRLQQLAADCRQTRGERDWDRLEELAFEWTRWDESDGSPWMFLAEAAEAKGDAERTAEFLEKVPDDDPRIVRALSARVELLFQELNRPLDAVATCQRILRIDPKAYVPRRRLIYFYALSLQRLQLVRQIRESIKRQREPPESYVYLFAASSLKFSNGYHTNSRWLENSPDHEAFIVARAISLESHRGGKELLALKIAGLDDEPTIAECLQRFPGNVEALVSQLEENTNAGNVERVTALLAMATADADRDSRVWRYRAWLDSMRGEFQASRTDLDKSVQLDPYDWQSRHQLAIVLRRLGMADEAGRMAKIAQTGKLLTREMQELPDAEAIGPPLLAKLADYADRCGDTLVAEAIRRRIE